MQDTMLPMQSVGYAVYEGSVPQSSVIELRQAIYRSYRYAGTRSKEVLTQEELNKGSMIIP